MDCSGSILKRLFSQAQKKGYAIPSFNYSDIWDMYAIIEVAQELGVPVIMASNPTVVHYLGIKELGALGVAINKHNKTQVFNHLDHSIDAKLCKSAVNAGYSSVMIDGSSLPLEQNISITKKVVKYAHSKGVIVEGELGQILTGEVGGNLKQSKKSINLEASYVKIDSVSKFVNSTQVDLLAIGVGNAHGFYKQEPKLRFDLIERVREITNIPLVLHGGTGLPKEDVHRAIKSGIVKVNIGTLIHSTYLKLLKKKLNEVGKNPYTFDVMIPVKEELKKIISELVNYCYPS